MAELTTSYEMEECDTVLSQWQDLSSPPLERIYSFLSRADQVNMSLVCHKWSRGYSSPAVWKTFRFALRDEQLLNDSCPVMKSVNKYSNMFQHVEVENILYNYADCDKWHKYFLEFLDILTRNSKLISIKFQNLYICFLVDSHISIYNESCRKICAFLGSQSNLKRVEFHKCFFGHREGILILRNLSESNGESLTHIALHGLVRPQDEQSNSNVQEILSILLSLPSLTILEIDYSFILGYMFANDSAEIKFLEICQTGVISNIILHYDNEEIEITNFQGLTSIDWRLLKELYPDQKIECNFKFRCPRREKVECLIMPNMPITLLDFMHDDDFKPGYKADYYMDIDVLLNHLLVCKTNDHLTSLNLKWLNPIQVSMLIPFFLACSKLKFLKLFLVHPADDVILLMDSWVENRPASLKKAYINISRIESNDSYTALTKFTTDYMHRLELKGLDLEVDLHEDFSFFYE